MGLLLLLLLLLLLVLFVAPGKDAGRGRGCDGITRAGSRDKEEEEAVKKV